MNIAVRFRSVQDLAQWLAGGSCIFPNPQGTERWDATDERSFPCKVAASTPLPDAQVARTKAAYDRMLFREALKSGM